ncbi:phenylacetic acid degradation PaaB family protein [Natrialbaceae archaeon A-gly3]
MKYEVFARINPGDETQHIGRIDAENDRLAKAYARATFDEESWDYMAVVQRDNVVPVEEHNLATQGTGGEPA